MERPRVKITTRRLEHGPELFTGFELNGQELPVVEVVTADRAGQVTEVTVRFLAEVTRVLENRDPSS